MLGSDTSYVLDKMDWMRVERIWPNGLRYLWTDAFWLVLLVSLYAQLGDKKFLDQAEWLVADVDRVLGRARGIRIGEAPDRDGQYFHYLAVWLYALSVLARYVPAYRRKGIDLVHSSSFCLARQGRGLENEGRFVRALSRLWPRCPGCLRRLYFVPLSRRGGAEPGNRGNESSDRSVCAGTVYYLRFGSWDDVVDDQHLPKREMG